MVEHILENPRLSFFCANFSKFSTAITKKRVSKHLEKREEKIELKCLSM